MGAIKGLFGLDGGAAGTGFAAPTNAELITPVSHKELEETSSQSENALARQKQLQEALQRQGGLANQSSVFNQLQGIASGQGPNPAMAMLNQQTGANIANQAALMAGQRGASANSGLMARQAAMQGGALQQNAIGQGATMQANQSLNALNQMGGIAGNQVSNEIGQTNALSSGYQARHANLLNALGAMNTAKVGSQSSVNAANAALAGTTMQGQQAGLGGLFNAAGAALGGGGGGNASAGGGGSPGGGGIGGGEVAGSSSDQMVPYNHGGVIGYAAGGPVAPAAPASKFGQFLSSVENNPPPPQETVIEMPEKSGGGGGDGMGGLLGAGVGALFGAGKGATGFLGKTSKGTSGRPTDEGGVGSGGGTDTAYPGGDTPIGGSEIPVGGGASSEGMGDPNHPGLADPVAWQDEGWRRGNNYNGGMVGVVLSPGEKVIPPHKVNEAAGGKVQAKTVPGQAKVAGDSIKNDTYKTQLPEGSIVVPRTKSKNNKDAAEFVRKVLAKRGRSK